MPKLIFINLPVADLARSVAFYEAVGATMNPLFSDETAACMVFSDTIHAMLLTHEKWATFTDRADLARRPRRAVADSRIRRHVDGTRRLVAALRRR